MNDGDEETKELVILGAGPHGLTLLLRLHDEEPDLLPEGTRANLAMNDTATVNTLGSWPYLKARVSAVCRSAHAKTSMKQPGKCIPVGLSPETATLKTSRMRGKRNVLHTVTRADGSTAVPLSLLKTGAVEVIDTHGEWLSEWHHNFAAFRIQHLRSAADVHPGPHDMRELMAY